jgi:hypothetical protein
MAIPSASVEPSGDRDQLGDLEGRLGQRLMQLVAATA